ncbi:hypothetical protein DC083_06570 [Ignatzschineria ureiclastica]|uniref:DUF4258 domain-containing protein n=1 Tax=Ignatzschineria ureiclastica TaxID=472582 RepID=A0A2U2ADZ2_9GAMM|nr:DUF4258 domain-containing protein [Ignatzschineria ureiclastica]PWD80769.1 hypothetical protein DC083_06570 [Ignatzschineria ureiclastica]GGZ94792.1 hypothetical protein GCM10007162_08380 [Ignatzschineria ureiclastica]
MQLSRHIDQRMNQRGITKEMVELTLEYGEIENDRWVLNRKRVETMIELLEKQLRTARKLRDKGGIVVVAEDNTLVTTYDYDSKDRY